MNNAKFALLSFETNTYAFERPGMQSPIGSGRDLPINELLATRPDVWVRINLGTYVLKVAGAGALIHQLLETIRQLGKTAALVYFDLPLSGTLPPEIVLELQEKLALDPQSIVA